MSYRALASLVGALIVAAMPMTAAALPTRSATPLGYAALANFIAAADLGLVRPTGISYSAATHELIILEGNGSSSMRFVSTNDAVSGTANLAAVPGDAINLAYDAARGFARRGDEHCRSGLSRRRGAPAFGQRRAQPSRHPRTRPARAAGLATDRPGRCPSSTPPGSASFGSLPMPAASPTRRGIGHQPCCAGWRHRAADSRCSRPPAICSSSPRLEDAL